MSVAQVLASSCTICERLYKDTQEAERCYKKCAKKQLQAKKEKEAIEKHEILANQLRLQVDDIHQIPKLLEQYVKEWFSKTLKITSFKVSFREDLSISHSAPIGMKTNWAGRDPSLPRGMPGWKGRIEGSMDTFKALNKHSQLEELHFSDMMGSYFKGINTGDGGGGNSSFSYDLDLFVDDFPKLKEKYETYLQLHTKAQIACDVFKDVEQSIANCRTSLIEDDVVMQECRLRISKMQEEIRQLTADLDGIQKSHAHEAFKKITAEQIDSLLRVRFDRLAYSSLSNLFMPPTPESLSSILVRSNLNAFRFIFEFTDEEATILSSNDLLRLTPFLVYDNEIIRLAATNKIKTLKTI